MSFYLIAGRLDSVYEVELPPLVASVVRSFKIDFALGINSVLDCLGMPGYVPLLAVHMAIPPVLALLIVLAVAVGLLCKRRFRASVVLDLTAEPILW